MTFQQYLRQKMELATSCGKEKTAIRHLLMELSNMDKATLIAHFDEPISPALEQTVTEAIDQYLYQDKPVQQILGYAYFYGLQLRVDQNVLIPRPETEELVEQVVHYYHQLFAHQVVHLVDIGTGSGALALALAKEIPNAHIYATDISEAALQVASKNAAALQLKVTFLKGDMLEPLKSLGQQFDILVSNPPYIGENEIVDAFVTKNEPSTALFGGRDGMLFYQKILSGASSILRIPNILAFEHGYLQKAALIKLIRAYFPQGEIASIKDMSGKDRMTMVMNRK